MASCAALVGTAYRCRRCRRDKRSGFHLWLRKIPWRKKWQPTREFLPGKSHGQRSLADYNPWSCKRVRHDLVTEKQDKSTCRGAIKPIYWHPITVKASAAFTAGLQARSPGQLVLKTPQLHAGFQESIFKDPAKRVAACVTSSCTILWLADGGVTGWSHRV